MREISLSKGKTAIVDDEDYEYLNQWKWCVNDSGYAIRGVGPKKNRKIIFMHRQLMDEPEGFKVDHINMNRLDNRRINLRKCTHKQNLMNSAIRSNNTSGYKGVSYDKSKKKWMASIRGDGSKHKFIGRYETKENAAIAYNNVAFQMHGEFAYLNKVSQ